MLWRGHRCRESDLESKIRQFLLIFNDLLQFFIMSHGTNGCYWFYMILSDIRIHLEVCIHTPNTLPTKGVIEIPHKSVNHGWLIEEGSCVQLSDIEPVRAILHKFQQTVTLFRHVSWQEKSFLLFPSYMRIRWFWLALSDIQENDDGSAV